MDNMYWMRRLLNPLPGRIMRAVPKPEPERVEGAGCRRTIGAWCRRAGYRRALIVTDKVLRGLGYAEEIGRSLEGAGIAYDIYDGICSEPTSDYVAEGRRRVEACGAQCVITLGGGSVQDTGKMVAAMSRLRHWPTATLFCKFLFVPGRTLPVLAVPSTAGTGAEMTVGTVIKKPGGGAKKATVIVGLDVRAVFLDSDLTVGTPWRITAACGMDALSHGLEGCLSAVASSHEDMEKSRRCVRLVMENLPVLRDDPRNAVARLMMSRAANLGGNAINRQLAGYIHAFAHTVGAAYHLSHGEAITLCMMPVLRHQQAACTRQLAALARYCGLAGYAGQVGDAEAARLFVDTLDTFIARLGLALDGSVVRQADYGRLAVGVARDSINYSSPVTLHHGEMIEIFNQISKIKTT